MKKTTPHSEQSKAFIEAARDLGCDEDPAHFEEKLKKVAAHKPPPTEPLAPPEDNYFIDEPIDVREIPTKTGNIDPDAGLRPRSRQSKRGASGRQTRRSGRK
jgi:hypothetical protein